MRGGRAESKFCLALRLDNGDAGLSLPTDRLTSCRPGQLLRHLKGGTDAAF